MKMKIFTIKSGYVFEGVTVESFSLKGANKEAQVNVQ